MQYPSTLTDLLQPTYGQSVQSPWLSVSGREGLQVLASPTTLGKPSAVVEIERLGFKSTEVAQYDLTRLSKDHRVQVRDENNYAPKDSVEQYSIQMAETEFPPIVVTNDDWIVDGNTRVGAALRRKMKFFPALVLDVNWKGTSAKRQAELYALAATLNNNNGQRLTAKETRNVAARFISLGWKTEQIGRAIGLGVGSVTAVKKEIDAADKLHRVGMDSNGSLKGASLRALGAKEVVGLNDVPFRELATLAADAGFNASEILNAAKDARATGSDANALEALATMRAEMGARIRDRKLTGYHRPPASRRLRQSLGNVVKFTGREQELIETDPKDRGTHIESITSAIAVLTEVLRLQGEYSS